MFEWLSAVLGTAAGKMTVAVSATAVAAGAVAGAGVTLPDAALPLAAPEVGEVEVQDENNNNTEEPEILFDPADEEYENHGQAVSAFARDVTDELELEGCETGQAVSLVARGHAVTDSDVEDIEAFCDADGAVRADVARERALANHPVFGGDDDDNDVDVQDNGNGPGASGNAPGRGAGAGGGPPAHAGGGR
jgi:hypothetical protein